MAISIHAPTRGATRLQKSKDRRLSNFNPRTHEGCDMVDRQIRALFEYISIHAPTRGATNPVSKSFANRLISIHAPTRGATTFTHLNYITVYKFQSTHPRGVRPVLHSWSLAALLYFNPRTHEGCD